MIGPRHYYVVHGWMLSELGLKGNALIAYAIIYGFSQDGASEYLATANYLASWMGCSRSTVMRVLKDLVEDGLLVKRDVDQDGITLCAYSARVPTDSASLHGVSQNDTGGVANCDRGVCQNDTGGCSKMTHSNNDNKDFIKNVKYIVEFLNEHAGTKFRASTKSTKELIHARLAEGFTVEDFETVIRNKCSQWKNDSKMAEYLRPSTLFGTKFEAYLNAPAAKAGKNERRPLDDDEVAAIQRMMAGS